MRHSRALKLTFVLGVVLAGTAPAGAVPMSFDLVGVDDSTLTAHVVFAYDSSSRTIDIDITNTSVVPLDGDPRFTAFAFNVPAAVTGVSSFAGPSGWSHSYMPNAVDPVSSYGFFDIAALTGPNFNGGHPDDGIATQPPDGPTFSFSFGLTGTGLDTLDEDDFLGEFSFDPPGRNTHDTQYFIGRFQRTGPGPEPTGSDVAIPSGPPVPVPEPVSLVLFGSGLTGLWWMRRRKS